MNYTPEITVFVHSREKESALSLKPNKSLRVLNRFLPDKILEAKNLFVITSVTELSEVANLVKKAENQQHLRGLFVRLNLDVSFVSQIFDDAKIHLTRNMIMHSSSDIPKRVIEAWLAGAQEQLIANASVVINDLFVHDCALNSWKIPFDIIPALKQIPVEERGNFELDEDGSYIYWPSADIHLDMEALRSAVDKEWQEKLKIEKVRYERQFGEAIVIVRKAHKLKQIDISGVSERHIRRIEKGEIPKVDTLKKIAQAHGMNLNEYLEEVAQTISNLKMKKISIFRHDKWLNRLNIKQKRSDRSKKISEKLEKV
jgi:transcriptional regulator with XRE-family HTH domain